jgi:hypothetical protein
MAWLSARICPGGPDIGELGMGQSTVQRLRQVGRSELTGTNAVPAIGVVAPTMSGPGQIAALMLTLMAVRPSRQV